MESLTLSSHPYFQCLVTDDNSPPLHTTTATGTSTCSTSNAASTNTAINNNNNNNNITEEKDTADLNLFSINEVYQAILLTKLTIYGMLCTTCCYIRIFIFVFIFVCKPVNFYYVTIQYNIIYLLYLPL